MSAQAGSSGESIREAAARKLENLLQQKSAPFHHMIDYYDRSNEQLQVSRCRRQTKLSKTLEYLGIQSYPSYAQEGTVHKCIAQEHRRRNEGSRPLHWVQLYADQEGRR